MRFDGEAIARATGGRLHGGSGTPGALSTDTRTLTRGDWFLALVGPRFDGHDYGRVARERGAAGGVFTHRPEGWVGPWVEVADTTAALAELGRAARARLTGPVVGITGSSGKTTTRALTAVALSQLGAVHQTVGNLNNHLGVPLTLCAAPEDAAVSVVEMGTSGPGEIAHLASIGKPDVRLIVNVGPAHLEELGGLDGVAREKGAMLYTASEDDTVLLNLDDPRIAPMEPPGRRIGWGRHPDAVIRLVSASVDLGTWSTAAVWDTPSGRVQGTLPAPGAHLALNATAALAVAYALDLDLARAAADLSAYEPVGMRLAVRSLPGGIRVVDDAYNANPDSMRASVGLLSEADGPTVAVLGDMLELGDHEARFHAEASRHALALDLDRVVLVGPRMCADAPEDRSVWCLPEGTAHTAAATALAERLADWLVALPPREGPRATVLLKGSRGTAVEALLPLLDAALEARCSTT